MIGLHRNFGLPDLPSHYVGERSWRALWAATSSADLATLPLAPPVRSLNAYAFYGLSPRSDDPADNRDCFLGSNMRVPNLTTGMRNG